MNVELRKWTLEDKDSLIAMCNSIDRSYLSDRLPNPYTNKSAQWWLNMERRWRHGSQQQGLPGLRQENEAAVHRLAAL